MSDSSGLPFLPHSNGRRDHQRYDRFWHQPGIVALGCILASFSAGIGRILFLTRQTTGSRSENLFFLGLCLGGSISSIFWGFGLFYTYQLPILSIVFSLLEYCCHCSSADLGKPFDVISPLRCSNSAIRHSHFKRLQMSARDISPHFDGRHPCRSSRGQAYDEWTAGEGRSLLPMTSGKLKIPNILLKIR